MIHYWRAEIAAEKRRLFRPHRCLVASDLFLDTIIYQRTCEACPIDCMKGLDNIYGNGSQPCRPKDKTYIYAQLGELVHSVTVEHAPKHEVICRSKHIGEKHKEGKTGAERQPPRVPFLTRQMSKWF
jgi:hypothetical protein